MTDVEVPEANLVGREGEGFKIAMFALDQGRFTVAAGATGLIRACRDASVTYAKDRQTFGTEIGQHQLVKAMIAHYGIRLSGVASVVAARWLMKNEGRRNTRETAWLSGMRASPPERCRGRRRADSWSERILGRTPVGRFIEPKAR